MNPCNNNHPENSSRDRLFLAVRQSKQTLRLTARPVFLQTSLPIHRCSRFFTSIYVAKPEKPANHLFPHRASYMCSLSTTSERREESLHDCRVCLKATAMRLESAHTRQGSRRRPEKGRGGAKKESRCSLASYIYVYMCEKSKESVKA